MNPMRSPSPKTWAIRWVALTGLCLSAPAARAAKPLISLDQSVRQANLVVVAKVLGMIDTRPAAKARKHFEAHRVQVLRTLKGVDATGGTLAVRPNGLLWTDGRSYVLFVKRTMLGKFAHAVPQVRTPATPANVAAARKAIAAQGAGVSPKPAFWMWHEGGWGAGMLREFRVAADRSFFWQNVIGSPRAEKRSFRILVGKLPAKDYKDLVAKVAAAGEGPDAEDAGAVSFRWRDAEGKQVGRMYTYPVAPPCAALMKRVESLAVQFGKAPTTRSTGRKHGRRLTRNQMIKLAEAAALNDHPKAKVTPPAATSRHLPRLVLTSPLKTAVFRAALLGESKTAPKRAYVAVTRNGEVLYPFRPGQFGAIAAAEDMKKWRDPDYLDAAMLYAHLTRVANEDGWKLLRAPQDFLAITHNMPHNPIRIGGGSRFLAARKIRPPRVVRANGKVTVEFYAWHLIGGALRKWTVQLAPTFEGSSVVLGKYGGGKYE